MHLISISWALMHRCVCLCVYIRGGVVRRYRTLVSTKPHVVIEHLACGQSKWRQGTSVEYTLEFNDLVQEKKKECNITQ